MIEIIVPVKRIRWLHILRVQFEIRLAIIWPFRLDFLFQDRLKIKLELQL